MYTYTKGHSRIAGTGIYLPEERVTTRDLLREIDSKGKFGIPEDWLERVTGIKEKRVTPAGVLPSDMAVAAAREAMERARVKESQIDAIIYTGLSRDFLEPATAHVVQAKLGASNATVFDVSNACHGFMNGAHIMDALIATGQVRYGLVVTGEQGSGLTRRAIRKLQQATARQQFVSVAAALTVGDAGAAALMATKDAPESGFVGLMLQSQGQHANLCTVGDTGSEGDMSAYMPGILAEGGKLITRMFKELMHERLRWRIEELAKCFIHQVATGGLFKVHKLAGVPTNIMPRTVDLLGNLVTANIPLSLHWCLLKNEIKAGDKIYLSAGGSGISLSQAGLIWDGA